MTREEAIIYLKRADVTVGREPKTKTAEALEMAIETMRKYQKINQILDDWENSGEEDDPINIIDSIEEVLEDGKIN